MRTAIPQLLPFFRSELQMRLMGLLTLDAGGSWTAERISHALQAPAASVHRELHRALDAGLIERRADSRPHQYRAAAQSPIYEPLRLLLERTVGLEQELAQVLGREGGVQVAVVHGSWAAGGLRPESDIDVLVVGDVDLASLRREVRNAGRRAGRDVDLTSFTAHEFREGLRQGNGFMTKIMEGPVKPLVGSLRDFE